MKLFEWHGEKVLKMTGQTVEAAIKRCIMQIQRSSKQMCPVDTGRLRASISSNWSGSGLSFGKVTSKAQEIDGVEQPPDEKGVFVGVTGTNVEYAESVEMGNGMSNPQPYLRPAFDKYSDWRKFVRPF